MPGYGSYVAELERLKQLTTDGVEFWTARDLQEPLGYDTWRRFADVIERAIKACESAAVEPRRHFAAFGKMVGIGSGAIRETDDWYLTRYACYLVAMNGDPVKEKVAFAQTYFAVQTHRQEQADRLIEIDRRKDLRGRVKDANKGLTSAAKNAGVQRFAIFHDAGYKALYGGIGKAEIQLRKGIPTRDDLLDCVGSTELAANYFRITQTEEKLRKDRIDGERLATNVHATVGSEVRRTMQHISGIAPEDLPAAPSLKRLPKAPSSGDLLTEGDQT